MANPSSSRSAADNRGGGGVHHRRSIPKTWDGVLIRGLWESHINTIVGVRFGDADADTYIKEVMDTLLPRWRKMKKDKHRRHCHEKFKHTYSNFWHDDGPTLGNIWWEKCHGYSCD